MNNNLILDAIILSSSFAEDENFIIEFLKHCCINCRNVMKVYKVCPVIVFEKEEYRKYENIKEYFKDGFLGIFPMILINKESSGFASCLNYGIKNSYSNLVMRLDTDDRLTTKRIVKQIQEIYERKIDICASYMIDKRGRILKYPNNLFGLFIMTSLGTNPIAHPSICFKREILNLEYNSKLTRCEDFELWITLLTIKPVKFKCLSHPLTIYNTQRSFKKDHENALSQIKIRFKIVLRLFIIGTALFLGIFPNLIRLIFRNKLLLLIRRNL